MQGVEDPRLAKWDAVIDVDLNRTLPHHVLFRVARKGEPGYDPAATVKNKSCASGGGYTPFSPGTVAPPLTLTQTLTLKY